MCHCAQRRAGASIIGQGRKVQIQRQGCLPKQHTVHGYTLLELLVSLAVAMILAMISTSWLPRVIQESRLTTAVNQLVSGLHLARSEAVKRGSRVVLCPTPDHVYCGDSSDWRHGWLLFVSESDRERDADEPILQTGATLGAGVLLQASNHRKRIVYQPDGSAGGSNASFTFCSQGNLARPRVVCLSNTGRPRLSFRTCAQRPIQCP